MKRTVTFSERVAAFVLWPLLTVGILIFVLLAAFVLWLTIPFGTWEVE